MLFPPPAPSHRGWALVGRELRLDSGLVLETLVGCLGLGWQPWAGLASAPLPSSSQTSICLLTSWPPRPFQFPGRSSVGQRKAVTCPAMATGATGPLLFWAEGLGDLGTWDWIEQPLRCGLVRTQPSICLRTLTCHLALLECSLQVCLSGTCQQNLGSPANSAIILK